MLNVYSVGDPTSSTHSSTSSCVNPARSMAALTWSIGTAPVFHRPSSAPKSLTTVTPAELAVLGGGARVVVGTTVSAGAGGSSSELVLLTANAITVAPT